MLHIKITKNGSVKTIKKDDIDFIKKNKNISKLSSWKYNNYQGYRGIWKGYGIKL